MPIVQFNYNQHQGELPPTSILPIDKKIIRVQLPRHAHNKKWVIVGVRAEYDSGKSADSVPFRWLEVELPELMQENKILYSLNSEGNTKEPSRNLRFYVNKYQIEDLEGNDPVRKSIVVNPNLNLGVHRLDGLELTCIVTAREGDNTSNTTPLLHYSVILEYE